MKLRIIDTNRGQLPASIGKAIELSGFTRREICKIIEQNEIVVSKDGYHFKLGKAEKKEQFIHERQSPRTIERLQTLASHEGRTKGNYLEYLINREYMKL